jgi:hypothetical protein
MTENGRQALEVYKANPARYPVILMGKLLALHASKYSFQLKGGGIKGKKVER